MVSGGVISVESVTGAGIGLRVAVGAAALAFGWLLFGVVAGGNSASAATPGDRSLLGADPVAGAVLDLDNTAPGILSAAESLGDIEDGALDTADEAAMQVPIASTIVGTAPLRTLAAPVLQAANDTLETVAVVIQAAVPDAQSAIDATVVIPPRDTAAGGALGAVGDRALPKTAEVAVSARSHPSAPLLVQVQTVHTATATDSEPYAPHAGPPWVHSDAAAPSTSTMSGAIGDIPESAWQLETTCHEALRPGDDVLPRVLGSVPDSFPD